MKFITEIKFIEDKKHKVIYEPNPGNNVIAANNHSIDLAEKYYKDAKAVFKTFELGAKNLL